MNKLVAFARKLKQDLFVLYFSYQDARTPWYAKAFAIIVVAYAFSPIDLIPDFIPVLGYLDDLLLVPLGIYLALKWIPEEVKMDTRIRVEQMPSLKKQKNWIAGAIILVIWAAVLWWFGMWLYEKIG